jgi:outer membrane protein
MNVRRPALAVALALLLVAPVARGEESRPEVDLTRPLTAEECVRLALDRNYAIRQASDQKGLQDANTLAAWGAFLPDFSVDYGYTHSKSSQHSRPSSFFSFPSESDANGYSLSANQTLLDLGTIFNLVAARRSAGAATEGVRAAEHQAAQIVRSQYYTLIESIKLEEVAREDLRLANEELRRTQSLFDVGSVARTDVLKSNVRVAEAQSALIAAENRILIDRALLNQALALPPDAPVQVVESLDPRAEAPDSVGAFAEALTARPDLKAARLRESAASANQKVAVSGKLPSLGHSWNRSFRRSRTDDLTAFTTEGEPIVEFTRRTSSSWSYSIGVNWRIFDGLVTESNMQRAKYNRLLAEHQLLNLENAVLVETRQALVAIRNADAQVRVAREARASAEEDLKLSQERYSVGLGTILELIDAQVNVSRARTGEVQAMAALKRAEAQLDLAIGRENW